MQNLQNLNFKLLAMTAFLVPLSLLTGCVPLAVTGAAAGTGVTLAEDRRSTGTMVGDESIEYRSNSRIKDKFGRKVHVEVTSYNARVLLTGEVSSERVRKEVEDIVSAVEEVRHVTNRIVVGEIRPLTSRSHDAWITSKVKARAVNEGKFQAAHIKVVTENGVVYLMGIVDREEAQNAVEIARSTGGVSDVVSVFEYKEMAE